MIIAIPKGRLFTGIMNEYIFKILKNAPEIQDRKYYYKNFFGKDLDLFIAKSKAIPQLLDSNMCQFGFCGADIMKESMVPDDTVIEVADLKLNEIDIVFAQRPNMDVTNLNHPIICATEFPNIASEYLTKQKLSHYILNTSGGTEGYSYIGADCIIDICETGATLKANGLIIKDTICKSSTRLYGRADIKEIPEFITKLISQI